MTPFSDYKGNLAGIWCRACPTLESQTTHHNTRPYVAELNDHDYPWQHNTKVLSRMPCSSSLIFELSHNNTEHSL